MITERMKALEAILADDPNDTFALYGLALEHKNEGDVASAVELLEKVLTIDVDQFYTYYQLGEILLAVGERDRASLFLTEGLKRADAAGHRKAAAELRHLLSVV